MGADETDQLLRQAVEGDEACWTALLRRHRERLRRMVALRLDHRLRGRIDPSDVLQEAHLEAWVRLADYLRNPTMPFFLWLRFLTGQKVAELHRRHLQAHRRSVGREVALAGGAPEASSAALAAHLLGRDPRPSEAAVRAELGRRLREVLDSMDPLDREILALRHFEQLTNAEAARVLDLQESAASKRYIRAVRRLRDLLTSLPGWEQLP